MHFAPGKANICSIKYGCAAIVILTQNATVMIRRVEHIPDEDRVKEAIQPGEKKASGKPEISLSVSKEGL